MSIEFQCSGCQKTLRVTALSAGKQARCPACGAVSQVPAAAGVGSAGKPAAAPVAANVGSRPIPPAPLPAAPRKPEANPFAQPASPRPSTNPYVSPAAVSPFGQASYGADHAHLPLASRGTRLLGAILDSLITMAPLLPALLVLFGLAAAGAGEDVAFGVFALTGLVGGLVSLGIFVYNCVLISNTGQSIAKRMLGMRIIRVSNGELPGFLHGVLLRILVPAAINQACNLFGLIDALWIFGEECRCLHDLIADTKVVDVSGETGGINRF